MADYKTGRTKTLTFTTIVSATVTQPVVIDPPTSESVGICDAAFSAEGSITLRQFAGHDVKIEAGAAIHNSDGTTHTDCNDWAVYTRITANLGGTLDTSVVYGTVTNLCAGASSYCHSFTCPMSGTVVFTCDVEEYFTPIIGDVDRAGASDADPPGVTQGIWRDRLRLGGTLTLTATIGANMVFITTPITAPMVASAWDYEFTELIVLDVANGTATWSAICTCDGANLDAGGWSYSAANGSGDGKTLTVINSGFPALHGVSSAIFQPNKTFTLNLRVNALYDLYPDDVKALVTWKQYVSAPGATPVPVVALVDIPAGTFAGTYVQREYTISVGIGGGGDGTFAQEYCAVAVKLQAASLLAVGESVNLARCMFRTYKWDAFTLSQVSSLSLMTGTQSVTLAHSVTGSITNTLSTADAAVSGTKWQDKDLSGFAYLSLIVNHTTGAAVAYSVKIGTKTWTKDKTGADLMTGATAAVIDLLAPSNITAQTDATDTQWEWQVSGGKFSCASDSWAWGVHSAANIKIDGLVGGTGGQTFNLSAMQLTRTNAPQVSFLPAFSNWLLEYPPATVGAVTTNTYVRRGVQGLTDGVQSLEYPDCRWVNVTSSGAPVDSYPNETFLSFVDYLLTGNSGTRPRKGWSGATLHDTDSSANLRDGFLNSGMGVVYAYGAGLMYTQSGGWVHGLDHATGTIPAQFVCDDVDFQPAAGDFASLDSGLYSGSSQIYCAAILRGDIYGLVLDTDKRAGATSPRHVTLTESGGTVGAAGQADTIAGGEYFHSGVRGTGTQYGKVGHSYTGKAQIGASPYPSATLTALSRYRLRLSFVRVSLLGKGVSYDVSRAGRHLYAYPHTDGNIHTGLNPLPVPDNASWTDADTSITAKRAVIRWARGTNSQQCFLLIITSDEKAKLYSSEDEGQTWTMSRTVSSDATSATFAVTNQGLTWEYYRKADGSLQGKAHDAQGGLIYDEFKVIDAPDCDDAPMDCRDFISVSGVWTIGIVYQHSATAKYISSTDGINFT